MNAATEQFKLFVAITDEILYDHPEHIDSPLIPYKTDMQCHHWLSVEINPDEQNSKEITAEQFAA